MGVVVLCLGKDTSEFSGIKMTFFVFFCGVGYAKFKRTVYLESGYCTAYNYT
jgi:hypothetical protein